MQDYVDTLIWWHYHSDWRVDRMHGHQLLAPYR